MQSFPAIVLILAACIPAFSQEQECLSRIIAADDSLGRVRNHACETISLQVTIENYAKDLQALDFSGCPRDFTQAFRRHREAWEAMSALVAPYPDLRGEMHLLFDHLSAGPDSVRFRSGVDAIWTTWNDVESSIVRE